MDLAIIFFVVLIGTAFVGMMLAPGTISPINYFYVLLSISLGAGSSAAFNMWFDEDIDKGFLGSNFKSSIMESFSTS